MKNQWKSGGERGEREKPDSCQKEIGHRAPSLEFSPSHHAIRQKGQKLDHAADNSKNNEKVIWAAAALVAALLLAGDHWWEESAIRSLATAQPPAQAQISGLSTNSKKAPFATGLRGQGALDGSASQPQTAAEQRWAARAARRAEEDRVEREAVSKLTPSQKSELEITFSKTRKSAQKVRDDEQALWEVRQRLGLTPASTSPGQQASVGIQSAATRSTVSVAPSAAPQIAESAARRPWGIYCLFTDV